MVSHISLRLCLSSFFCLHIGSHLDVSSSLLFFFFGQFYSVVEPLYYMSFFLFIHNLYLMRDIFITPLIFSSLVVFMSITLQSLWASFLLLAFFPTCTSVSLVFFHV
jgi:hypothetical protein